MRWTEIEGEPGAPVYRLMDKWTRAGRIKAELKGDKTGLYRDWPAEEAAVAMLVTRLIQCGFTEELAFQLARTQPDKKGGRRLILDGAERPRITVQVDGR